METITIQEIVNRINNFLEPGPYEDEHKFQVVVLEVVTHSWNIDKGLQEVLPESMVLARNLVETKEQLRYIYPISIFKEKFKPL